MQQNRRRTLRVPLSVPLIVSDPKPQGFTEYCETVMANSHGCQLRSPCPLETGMQVRLETVYAKNRAACATVIHCEPVGLPGTRVWNCGLALDTPGNFWGIPSPPQDWPAADYPGMNGLVPSPPPSSERGPSPVHPGPPRDLDRSPQDWPQMLSTIEGRIAGLEARVEQVSVELETAALTRLQQSFGEMIRQVRERLNRYVAACGESRLVGMEAEVEQRVMRIVNQNQAAISELERRLESVRQEHEAWETRMTQQWQQGGVHHRNAPELSASATVGVAQTMNTSHERLI